VIGALLAARLEDDARLADRVAHRTAFRDRERERLLAIDILLRPARLDHGDRVPVVRGADLDRVDVRPAEELAVIDDRVAAAVLARRTLLGIFLFDQTPRGFAAADLAVPVPCALLVHVADGHNLHSLILEERARSA